MRFTQFLVVNFVRQRWGFDSILAEFISLVLYKLDQYFRLSIVVWSGFSQANSLVRTDSTQENKLKLFLLYSF